MKRKVLVNGRKYIASKSGCGCWTGEDFEAVFHTWGLKMDENNKNDIAINYTVAIVEDKDGKIHAIRPEYITFKTE